MILTILAMLNLVDCWLTVWLRKRGARELNPLADKLLECRMFVPVKVALSVLMVLFDGSMPEPLVAFAVAAVILYAGVVVNNGREVKKVLFR